MMTIVDEDPNESDGAMRANNEQRLLACHDRAEWLAAASTHRSSGVTHCVVCANGTPQDVLNALCVGQMTTPACRS